MPNLPVLNAIGTPEQLLRHRPDVRIAERRLAAATARIGVAMGDLFPKVTMIGEVGYSAPTFGDFGTADARFFSVGPSISWAAFDLGRVQARIKSAQAQTVGRRRFRDMAQVADGLVKFCDNGAIDTSMNMRPHLR